MPARVDLGKDYSHLRLYGAVDPQQLAAQEFPRPRLSPNRRMLLADVGPHEYGVAVQVGSGPRVLWQRGRQYFGKVAGTKLIEPPLDLLEFEHMEHAPLSAVHHRVKLRDNTPYRVGLWLPTAPVNAWSEEKTRYSADAALFGSGWRELYQQQTTIGAVVRINGEPLSENIYTVPQTVQVRQGPFETSPLVRRVVPPHRAETFTRFDLTKSEARHDYMFNPLAHGQMTTVTDPEAESHASVLTDLVFRVTGAPGEASNADYDTKDGLVQVVFVTVPVAETVLGMVYDPTLDPRSRGGGFGTDQYVTSGAIVQGRTERRNQKPTVTKIKTVKEVKPIAEINLALVG